ncbi:hypothetical protein RCL1_000006 [Eukaryota sp. TZLM3-RCL]
MNPSYHHSSFRPSASPSTSKQNCCCKCPQLESKVSLLQDSVTDQVYEFSALNGRFNDLGSFTNNTFTSFSSRMDRMDTVTLNQFTEISVLKSKIESQNSELNTLRTENEQQVIRLLDLNAEVLSLKSQLKKFSKSLDEFQDFIPLLTQFLTSREHQTSIGHQATIQEEVCSAESVQIVPISHQQVMEQEHVETENRNRLNPTEFICKYPNNFYSRFGSRIKFIRETIGARKSLHLSKSDCLVKNLKAGRKNSFIAINHPPSGKFSVTLRSAGKGCFWALIGHFCSLHCQSGKCENHFVGAIPYRKGVHFQSNESHQRKVTSKLSLNQSVIVSFENNKVTYSTPHSGWSRTVDCVDGWVFGISLFYQGESWSVK